MDLIPLLVDFNDDVCRICQFQTGFRAFAVVTLKQFLVTRFRKVLEQQTRPGFSLENPVQTADVSTLSSAQVSLENVRPGHGRQSGLGRIQTWELSSVPTPSRSMAMVQRSHKPAERADM